jgi:hypothetical protein
MATSPRMQQLSGELDRRRLEGGSRAATLEREVDTRRGAFDATEYARTASSAAFEDFREDYDRGISDLRGQQVAMGRMKTGFATEDEDRLGSDLNARLAREMARNSFTAAQLDQDNVRGMSADGVEARAGSDAALAGGLDREQADINERQKRKSRFLGLLGAGAGAVIGGVAGSIVPGLGTAVGAGLGARIGSKLGG